MVGGGGGVAYIQEPNQRIPHSVNHAVLMLLTTEAASVHMGSNCSVAPKIQHTVNFKKSEELFTHR